MRQDGQILLARSNILAFVWRNTIRGPMIANRYWKVISSKNILDDGEHIRPAWGHSNNKILFAAQLFTANDLINYFQLIYKMLTIFFRFFHLKNL
jgi:hypothetical protein